MSLTSPACHGHKPPRRRTPGPGWTMGVLVGPGGGGPGGGVDHGWWFANGNDQPDSSDTGRDPKMAMVNLYQAELTAAMSKQRGGQSTLEGMQQGHGGRPRTWPMTRPMQRRPGGQVRAERPQASR